MTGSSANRIFDTHCHVFPDKIAVKASGATGDYYGVKMRHTGTVDVLKEAAFSAGITDCLVCSAATKPNQVAAINDFIASVCAGEKHFLGFGSLHPHMEDMAREAERMEKLGIAGIKIHADFQGFRLDDPKAYRLYELVEGRFPILFHMGDINTENTTPEQLIGIVKRFPKLKIIAAHLGGYSVWDRAALALPDLDIVVDTSSSLPFIGAKKGTELVKVFGAERCLFGTDYPMWDHAEELERFNALDLTDGEREMILWKNAAEFLNLEEKLYGAEK